MSMTNFRVEDMPGKSRKSTSKGTGSEEQEEDVKIAHAADSPQAQNQQSQQDQSQQQQQTGQQQTTSQQSGQESGQPAEQGSEEGDGEPADTEPVPDGTSAEVMAWVGDDKKRAQAALDKEQANERPRVGLTEDLQKVING